MWKDATNATLPVIGQVSDDKVLFQDANGRIWSYDLIRDYVFPAHENTLPTYYSSTSCTGTAYVLSTIPTRYTFFGGAAYQVRPDGLLPILISAQSVAYPGLACQIMNQTISVVPVSGLASITDTPPFPGVAPIHVEFVP